MIQSKNYMKYLLRELFLPFLPLLTCLIGNHFHKLVLYNSGPQPFWHQGPVS